MRDLFDDFMKELRRREAIARGEDPDAAGRDRRPDSSGDGGQNGDRDDDPARDTTDDREVDDGIVDGDVASDDDEPARRPVSITERRRRGRGPGGPDDGGSSRAARAGRRFGLGVAVIAVISVILLFSVGIDLWTDALWFRSVGFDSVFWTRIGATVGLGVGAFLIAAIALLTNLWIAGRLAPPPGEGGGSFRSLVDRLNDAAQAADERRGGTRSQYGTGRDRWGGQTTNAVTFDVGDIPDLTPL